MKYLILATVLLATPVFAADPQPSDTIAALSAMLQQAQGREANVMTQLAAAQREEADLRKQLADSEAKLKTTPTPK
jgi:septal ring factor EnvC (AmiA/AmiB activator)